VEQPGHCLKKLSRVELWQLRTIRVTLSCAASVQSASFISNSLWQALIARRVETSMERAGREGERGREGEGGGERGRGREGERDAYATGCNI